MAKHFVVIVYDTADDSKKSYDQLEKAVIKVMKEVLPAPVVSSIHLELETPAASTLVRELFVDLDKELKK